MCLPLLFLEVRAVYHTADFLPLGDLDLAVGNDEENRVYENQNEMLELTASWTSTDGEVTENIAWGDVDRDGDLDLNVGGKLPPGASWSAEEGEMTTHSVAWGDMDGDGDLDLLAGNENGSVVYENSNGVLPTEGTPVTHDYDAMDAAWGDIDGDLDLAVGNKDLPNKLYLNTRDIRASQTTVPRLAVSLLPYQANFYAMAEVMADAETITTPMIVNRLVPK